MGTDRASSFRCLAAAALVPLAGCFSPNGILFTNTTVPYYLPYEKGQARASKHCTVALTQLKEPLTGTNLSVLWTSSAVAAAAKNAGISELRYIDLHTFSVANDAYVRRNLIFYGE